MRERDVLAPRLQLLLEQDRFDPARLEMRVRIGMTDHAAGVLLAALLTLWFAKIQSEGLRKSHR